MPNLPYLPNGREILYVSVENEFMQAAKQVAETQSLDPGHKNGAVIVKEGKIIGRGANGSWFHYYLGCLRKLVGAKTGCHYWLCPGCQPRHHAEQSAIKDALRNGHDPKGADLYMWGHWWCCQSCWQKMIKVDIKNVYLPEGAAERFG